MGNCLTQNSGGGGAVTVDRSRRRLSLSSSAQAVVKEGIEKNRGKVDVVDHSKLLDLFPNSGRKMSLCGQPASGGQQKGFDSKKANSIGDESLLKDDDASVVVGFACKKGLKPESPNQDDFFILRVDDWGIFGVFDGHGPYGHDISNYAHDNLPGHLVRDGKFENAPCEAFVEAFQKTQRGIETAAAKYSKFDCALSGTTATCILFRNGKIHAAHVGDSRAVAGVMKDGKLTAEDLTHDHKPNDPIEQKRIESVGGCVKRLDGDIPHRIFLKNRLYPGLAMSRSLGDTVGVTAGVSCTPDTNIFDVTEDHRFFMLCSDGVWEFISSQEAVDIVSNFGRGNIQKGAEALAQEAWKRWIEEEQSVVDDITVIIGYLGKE